MASASSVLQLGRFHKRPLRYWLKPFLHTLGITLGTSVSRWARPALQLWPLWKNHQWMEWGVPLGMVGRRKVVSTDASNLGWGALSDGKPIFGLRSKEEGYLHINCLEMLAVYLGLRTFLPDLRGHHILVRSVSMTVASYINRQGGLSSRCLFILAERLLRWAQLNLRSLRATNILGKLNLEADMLSWSNVPSDEWTLHPQTVQEIWGIFSRPEVELFTSEDKTHCQTYFSKNRDVLAHDWPNHLLFAFPPIALIPQVIRRIREQKHRVLLSAPLWKNQHWFAELARLLTVALWPIPLRRDLLSQANGTILAPPVRHKGATSLASQWEPSDLPESVLNTISQARAPSLRRLYVLKWTVFSAWCTTRGADPVVCDISLIYCWYCPSKGHSPFTLKVYVAAIAAAHAPINVQSVGRNNLVVHFLKGSRRLNPPLSPSQHGICLQCCSECRW